MKTILLTAYDIDPYKGSESGTGWNFVDQAARFNKVIAITRRNNRLNIEKYLLENEIDIANFTFQYFDLPYYLRFWKKGARGSSLYFYLWQMAIPLFVRKKKMQFDIAHNVNFHADAFPSFLWVLGKPVVWGPINHNEKIPRNYITSNQELIFDRIKWIIKNISWNFDPLLLLAKKKSHLIIGGNNSVQKRLNIPDHKFLKLTQLASHIPNPKRSEKTNKYTVLMVGRLMSIKSFEIGIYAYNKFYERLNDNDKKNVKLVIIGKGPLENKLMKIVQGLESMSTIHFNGLIDKNRMDNIYETSNVFIFPSHEGAGMVTIEALSHGLPIICFDNFGPGELVNSSCAFKIQYSNYDKSIEEYSDSIFKLFTNKNVSKKMSNSARELFMKKYTWISKGIEMNKIYDSLS